MKVIDIINRKSGPFPSLEFVPPLKGSDINRLYSSIEPFMEFKPPFINITCHREEIEYRDNPDGTISKYVLTKRPGTVAIAAAVMKRFPIEVVPHIICGGTNRFAVENELIDLNFLDIQNVMALRGDAPVGRKRFNAEPDGYSYSNELVSQIKAMNEGTYIDENIKDAVPTNFCIGVAGYPEKHFEAPNIEVDIDNLKRKVDAGADYIITQMFFDNVKYFEFVAKCREKGITVPIIPGLKPFSTTAHLTKLPETFSIDIPPELVRLVNNCKDEKQVYQLGIEWCVAQSKELIAKGAPAIHYYTMGRGNNITEVIKRVF